MLNRSRIIRFMAYAVAFPIVFGMGMQSCKSTKKQPVPAVTKQSQDVTPSDVATQGSSKTTVKKVAFVVNEPKVSTINISNASVTIITGGQELSSRASIRVIRDSIVQISLQPALGIEMARLDITPKSVVAVNKLQNRYFESNMDYLAKMLGMKLDYYDFQALLLNRIFIAGESLKNSKEVLGHLDSKTVTPTGIQMLGSKNAAGFSHEFDLDKNGKLVNTQVKYQTSMSMRCTYSQFRTQNSVTFPFMIFISALQGKSSSKLSIEIKKAEFNQAVTINPTDKSKYKKVTNPEELFSK